MTATLTDRLQPPVLDRLTDDPPPQREEAEDRSVMTKPQRRQAVLRRRWPG